MLSKTVAMGKKSMTLGEFFKEIRRRRNWSQTRLSVVLNCNQGYISRLEKNEWPKPPLDFVKILWTDVLLPDEKEELMLVLYSSIDSYLES